MQYQTISIKDVRDNLAEVVEQVAVGGKTYVITKFGKLKAMIVPVTEELTEDQAVKNAKFKKALDKSFGMFKHRTDMKDSAKWVRQQRKPRYDNIFG